MTETTLRITGTLTGQFWWPIGETWTKDIREIRTVRRGTRFFAQSETPDLRTLIVDLVCDGDSSNRCALSPDTEITIERTTYDTNGRRLRSRKRYMPITAFPSVADCVAPE